MSYGFFYFAAVTPPFDSRECLVHTLEYSQAMDVILMEYRLSEVCKMSLRYSRLEWPSYKGYSGWMSQAHAQSYILREKGITLFYAVQRIN